MASVRRLTDEAGEVRGYKVRYRTAAGKARSRTFPVGHKGAADRFAVKVEADKIGGTELDPRGERITVGQYLGEWTALQVHRRGTAIRGANALKLLGALLGDRPLRKVRPSDIRAWLKARGETVAASTLRTDYQWVRQLFRAAAADQLIRSSPCDGIRLEAAPRPHMVVVEPGDVLSIAARLPAGWATLAPLGARCGLRPAELLGLCVEQVDFLRFELHVDRQLLRGRVIAEPKTAASRRTVPLDADTVSLISAHLAAFPAGQAVSVHDRRGQVVGAGRLVFHRPDGRPISHSAMDDTWRRQAARAGLPGVRPHDMRHFYASHMIRRGASAVLVSQLLGHARPSITYDIYAHEFGDRDERARALVADIWAVPVSEARPGRVLGGPEGLRQ
jgi:integrase